MHGNFTITRTQLQVADKTFSAARQGCSTVKSEALRTENYLFN